MTPVVPSPSKVSVLLLGGGRGSRMGGAPKAFLVLDGITLLRRCVTSVAEFADEIIAGLPAELTDDGIELVGADAVVVAGGETRQQTLDRLLGFAGNPLVAIHDLARPFATAELWRRVLEAADQYGAAAPVVSIEARDSMAMIDDGSWLGSPVDRTRAGLIQTPYAFTADLLRAALASARRDRVEATSITTLVTRLGESVRVVEGDPANIKITYGEDWDEALRRCET